MNDCNGPSYMMVSELEQHEEQTLDRHTALELAGKVLKNLRSSYPATGWLQDYRCDLNYLADVLLRAYNRESNITRPTGQ